MKQTYDDVRPDKGWPPAEQIPEIFYHRKATKAARQNNCPHIAQYYDHHVSRNLERYFVFMEYAPHKTLGELIEHASSG